jgi:hypothetical protein
MAAAPPAGGIGVLLAVPPILAPALVPAPQAPVLTFVDRYHDMRYDKEAHNYTQLLAHFDPMSPNAFTAAQLHPSGG